MIDRRTLLLASGTAAAALNATPRAAHAAATPQGPMPGYYRRRVGQAEVTAILDGTLALTPDIVIHAEPATRDAAVAADPRGDALRAYINAFVVTEGGRAVLIDAGGPKSFAPTMGEFPGNLARAGFVPGDISTVLITHLHVDHVAGLVDAQGRAVFPQAELVVAEAEAAFWRDDGALSRAPQAMHPLFQVARATLDAYRGRVRLFGNGATVSPGITALALPGHTPGHTGFRLASGNRQMLIWGDIVHVPALQFSRPDWSVAFDTDPIEARETRKRLLDQVAAESIEVTGAHLAFPGFGFVTREHGAYAYLPSHWAVEG